MTDVKKQQNQTNNNSKPQPKGKPRRPRRRQKKAPPKGGSRSFGSKIFSPSLTGSYRGTIPSAVYGKSYKTFFRRVGKPVHKEWGEGCRVMGISLFGTLFSTTSGTVIFNSAEGQADSDGTNFQIYDLYAAAGATAAGPGPLFRKAYALHPGLIARLNQESNMWGRYCFRSISVMSECQAASNNQDGWVVGLTHDVSWPLSEDFHIAGDLPASSIASLGNHDNGSFWKCFALRADDYNGDRVWSTSLPVVSVRISGPSAYTGDISETFLGPYCETYYQYAFAAKPGGDSTVNAHTFLGYVYISYVIDFYAVKNESSTMDDINFEGSGLLGSTEISDKHVNVHRPQHLRSRLRTLRRSKKLADSLPAEIKQKDDSKDKESDDDNRRFASLMKIKASQLEKSHEDYVSLDPPSRSVSPATAVPPGLEKLKLVRQSGYYSV